MPTGADSVPPANKEERYACYYFSLPAAGSFWSVSDYRISKSACRKLMNPFLTT